MKQNTTTLDLLLNVVAKDARFSGYVRENGFPNSELALDLMNQAFGLELRLEASNRVKTINTYEANVERLTQIYSEL